MWPTRAWADTTGMDFTGHAERILDRLTARQLAEQVRRPCGGVCSNCERTAELDDNDMCAVCYEVCLEAYLGSEDAEDDR